MARKRHTPEQIPTKLRDADVLLSQGQSTADVARHLEVSEQTYHRWRAQFGGMKADEMKRLKELEKEKSEVILAQAASQLKESGYSNPVKKTHKTGFLVDSLKELEEGTDMIIVGKRG